jgi:adenylosuccinate lyase
MVGEHERDGRAWKAEWIALPEACLLTGAALALARRLLEGLEVGADRMLGNLEAFVPGPPDPGCTGAIADAAVRRGRAALATEADPWR